MTTTRQLSPLEVGKDNSKLEPKKLRKMQIHQYSQTKGCYRGLCANSAPSYVFGHF